MLRSYCYSGIALGVGGGQGNGLQWAATLGPRASFTQNMRTGIEQSPRISRCCFQKTHVWAGRTQLNFWARSIVFQYGKPLSNRTSGSHSDGQPQSNTILDAGASIGDIWIVIPWLACTLFTRNASKMLRAPIMLCKCRAPLSTVLEEVVPSVQKAQQPCKRTANARKEMLISSPPDHTISNLLYSHPIYFRGYIFPSECLHSHHLTF